MKEYYIAYMDDGLRESGYYCGEDILSAITDCLNTNGNVEVISVNLVS